MTTAVLHALSFQDQTVQENIKQVQARTANPSVYREVGGLFDKGAVLVENQWQSFSADEKATLESLAYNLLNLSADKYQGLSRLLMEVRTFALRVKGQEKDLYYCIRAFDKFVDSVLYLVEMDNSDYKAVMSDIALDISGGNLSKEVTNRREWLRDLSDQAISEV